MTIRLKTGGPAFPVYGTEPAGTPLAGSLKLAQAGLTKREYFAAHAPDVPAIFEYKHVRKIVTVDEFGERGEMRPESDLARIVRWRLQYADQMLAALAGAEVPTAVPVAPATRETLPDSTGLCTVRGVIAYMLDGHPAQRQAEMVVPVPSLGKRVNIEIYITKVSDLTEGDAS